MDDDLKKEISETIIAYAVRKNHEREMNSIPTNEELARMYSLSERHEKRMKKLFAKENRKEALKKIFVFSKRAAAVCVITVASLFAFLLVNPQLRASFHKTVVEWRDGFTRFSFSDEETAVEYTNWYLAGLPEGFEEINTSYVGDMTSRIYWSKEGAKINFDYSITGNTLSVDNAHSDHEIIEFDGIEYYVFSSTVESYSSKIIWAREGYSFNLDSVELGSDELLELAKSIKREE